MKTLLSDELLENISGGRPRTNVFQTLLLISMLGAKFSILRLFLGKGRAFPTTGGTVGIPIK